MCTVATTVDDKLSSVTHMKSLETVKVLSRHETWRSSYRCVQSEYIHFCHKGAHIHTYTHTHTCAHAYTYIYPSTHTHTYLHKYPIRSFYWLFHRYTYRRSNEHFIDWIRLSSISNILFNTFHIIHV